MIQPSGAIVPRPSPSKLGLADQDLPAADLIAVLDGRPLRKTGRALPAAVAAPRYVIATQITALANWLQHRQAPAPQRIWIATDPDHTARATLLARLALAGRGIQIQPDPPPTPSPSEHRKLLRDALRLTLWRFTGSTGAWLVPQIVARKWADCGA